MALIRCGSGGKKVVEGTIASSGTQAVNLGFIPSAVAIRSKATDGSVMQNFIYDNSADPGKYTLVGHSTAGTAGSGNVVLGQNVAMFGSTYKFDLTADGFTVTMVAPAYYIAIE